MHYIDLTHTFTKVMPVYPGDPNASLEQIAAIDTDTFTDHRLITAMHVGTHLDAPLHMIIGGKKVDELPLESFFGPGVLLDARDISPIDARVLKDIPIPTGAAILIYTGFGDAFREPGYFDSTPAITEDFADELLKHSVTMVGMDTSGPDHDTTWPTHKKLLGNGVLILENLCNLEKLLEVKNFAVIALPMKLQSDAAPVRVVATIENA